MKIQNCFLFIRICFLYDLGIRLKVNFFANGRCLVKCPLITYVLFDYVARLTVKLSV